MPAAPEIWFPHLGIAFEKVSRVAVTVFGFPVYWYGVCIVTGVILALLLARWEAGRTGQKKDDYIDMLLMGLAVSLICTRLYYVVFSWEQFKDNLWDIFNFRKGGLAIYGGLMGAVLSAFIASKWKKLPISLILDTCAPSFLIGQIVGRFGNFFNREAFGGYTDNPFAMRLLADQANGVTPELLANAVTERGAQYVQVHPTFLYESAWNLALMVALILYRPRKKFPGEVMYLYMLGYGFARFFIEGLRTDQLIFFNTGIPASQITSVVFVLFALTMIVIGRVKVKKFDRTRV
ncbi:MAG: prolipoprotein diacylglyceryl transferase [Clostridiales bacterium]|jgi:phosphatidylglycerol:prolipoprotein diacylglycerol transferase|nr:prolipoprotein diacylglyceryl transferase [Clostridiales bacterium]